jgi:hypothetical protein
VTMMKLLVLSHAILLATVWRGTHSQATITSQDTYQVSVNKNSTVRIITTMSDISAPVEINFGDGNESPMSSTLIPVEFNPIYASLTSERGDALIDCKHKMPPLKHKV